MKPAKTTKKPWEAVCTDCHKRVELKADGYRLAVKMFRARGWQVGRDWATCPKCVRKKPR